MKIIFAYGSTRPNSASKKVLDAMAESARAAGHTVLTYDLTQPLMGCLGCAACRKTAGNCVQKDVLDGYFDQLFTADRLVVSAPIYMGQPAGQSISFMNRHYCLKDKDKQNRLPAGKKVTVVFAQGAAADYPGYEPVHNWLMNSFVRYGMEPGEKQVIGGDTDLTAGGAVMTWANAWGNTL